MDLTHCDRQNESSHQVQKRAMVQRLLSEIYNRFVEVIFKFYYC